MISLRDDELSKEIFLLAIGYGASLIGFTALDFLKKHGIYCSEFLSSFTHAISIAVVLPSKAIEMIKVNSPGVLYAHAYKVANSLLDHISFKISTYLISKGYITQPIPASLILDHQNLRGHLPHKTFALASGLGWIGRNLLLINPKYGPRIRLATILTNAKLESTGKPMENKCGSCRACIEACPTKALKYSEFKFYPIDRDRVFNAHACSQRLFKMKDNPLIGASICGVCIKSCPVGRFK